VIRCERHNYAALKHPKVRAWLARYPRWTFHFTPTSCSRVNAVMSFFATLTRRRLRRGVFHSLGDPQAAINRYFGEHNSSTTNPNPLMVKWFFNKNLRSGHRRIPVLYSIVRTIKTQRGRIHLAARDLRAKSLALSSDLPRCHR
jgi:hypothetical protein